MYGFIFLHYYACFMFPFALSIGETNHLNSSKRQPTGNWKNTTLILKKEVAIGRKFYYLGRKDEHLHTLNMAQGKRHTYY